VDRLACVDVPVLPLQLLLRTNSTWGTCAVAVVEEDRPQALLTYVNNAARKLGVLPGQRFAAALGLARDLRAGAVSKVQVEDSVREIAERLRRASPEVEADVAHPGVFWVDASGLERIQPSLLAWGRGIAADLQEAGFEATVVVGFRRFGTYAVAKGGRGVKVFDRVEDEDAALRAVPLRRLDLDPETRDRLLALGTRTAGDFLRLPAGGLRERYGQDVYRLHQLAAGKAWAPLQPLPYEEPRERSEDLEAPDGDAERLLFLVKRLLDSLLAQLARRSELLAELRFWLRLDNHTEYQESLRPAAPTLDAVQILGLVRLRLETLRLKSGVVEVKLTVKGQRAAPGQIELFRISRRDPEAAHRAFARLRAEMGEDVVARAVPREGHLPSARFTWEPMEALPDRPPTPREVAPRPLVRRVYGKPVPLPPRPRTEPDGWLLRGEEHGRVECLDGPYVVSGGWWGSHAVHREYYFARLSRGELVWMYYDKRRRRYFLEGRVE
jgi:protein ImuB